MCFLIFVDADFLCNFSEPSSFIRIFTTTIFSLSPPEVMCLLISHISAQDGECVAWMKKETFSSCLFPLRSPPLTRLSTLRRGKAKQTAVQTPQIITQESHWERCVGSGCDSTCAPTFTDIHLHMSQPPSNQKPRMLIWRRFRGNKQNLVAYSSCMLHIYYHTR